jgi:hypothetical protein
MYTGEVSVVLSLDLVTLRAYEEISRVQGRGRNVLVVIGSATAVMDRDTWSAPCWASVETRDSPRLGTMRRSNRTHGSSHTAAYGSYAYLSSGPGASRKARLVVHVHLAGRVRLVLEPLWLR